MIAKTSTVNLKKAATIKRAAPTKKKMMMRTMMKRVPAAVKRRAPMQLTAWCYGNASGNR